MVSGAEEAAETGSITERKKPRRLDVWTAGLRTTQASGPYAGSSVDIQRRRDDGRGRWPSSTGSRYLVNLRLNRFPVDTHTPISLEVIIIIIIISSSSSSSSSSISVITLRNL